MWYNVSNPPNEGQKLGCLFGNPLSGGPKLLQTHECPGVVGRVRPIPVSGISQYSPVSMSIGIGRGVDTSSPVIHLPVSTPFHARV